MTVRTDTKTLVLASLSEGPLHGYALMKSIQESLGEHHRLGRGQVYIALRGLEAEGRVLGNWDDGSAERRVYHITEVGRVELAYRTAEWHQYVDVIAQMLPGRRSPSPDLLSI